MRQVMAACALVGLAACGGGGGGNPAGPSAPPATPAVSITTSGAGIIVVHPSLQGFAGALAIPIRITETNGGTADWNYARYAASRGGAEVERQEVTADIIRAAGFSRIAARQNETYELVYHVNVTDFDSIALTLGFGDLRDGRLVTTQIPFTSFDGVDISLVPLSRPAGPHRLD